MSQVTLLTPPVTTKGLPTCLYPTSTQEEPERRIEAKQVDERQEVWKSHES